MRKVRQESILRYISFRFVGIVLLLSVFMIVFITYFSDAAIEFDIKSQLRRKTEANLSCVSLQNGKICVEDDFSYEEDGIHRVVLTLEGQLVSGEYEVPELENYMVDSRKVRKVSSSGGKYFLYDRIVRQSSGNGQSYRIAVIRSYAKKQDISSQYRSLKYISYGFILSLLVIMILAAFLMVRQIVAPLEEMCRTAEQIGEEGDISQRISYEGGFREIRILANANNRMLDRLEEMLRKEQQFTSDVAHELRTPVSVVMAECQYAQKHLQAKEDYVEALELIERQTRKTNLLITQLLNLSRMDQARVVLDRETVDLADLIQTVCENEKLRDTKGIEFRLDLSAAEVSVDVNLMMAVLRNLINNAVKYSGDGRQVDVSLRDFADHAEVTVRDYGVGMSEEVRKKIFDRFYRADLSRNSEGFGLGLSITKEIVLLHGGKITVESREGEGSLFILVLPKM